MRKTLCAFGAAALALWAAGAARSGDKTDPISVIRKAVEARGGADKLSKFQASTIKGKGTFYGQADQGVPFEGQWVTQGQGQMRIDITINPGAGALKLAKVVNGDEGWEKFNDDKAQKLGKDRLAEEKVQTYAGWVATLLPLTEDKDFQLASLPEAKVGDKAAVGVKVSRKGQRDVSLYFDKSTYLPLKTTVMLKDVESGSGKDMLLEIAYGNYMDQGGAKVPMHMMARRDGKPYIEGVLSVYRGEGKLDNKAFAPP